MKTKIKNGFTLVELLVYMALMGMFLVVLLEIFTLTISTKLSSQSTSSLAYDGRYILSKLSYEIKHADSVLIPSLGVTASTLQLVSGGVASTYSLSSGNLIKTTAGNSQSLNGLDTNIDTITFKNIGNSGGKPTIQINYVISSKILVSGGNQTQTISTTVGLR